MTFLVVFCRHTQYEQLFKRAFYSGDPWFDPPITPAAPLSKPPAKDNQKRHYLASNDRLIFD